jgi:hypothetical protein
MQETKPSIHVLGVLRRDVRQRATVDSPSNGDVHAADDSPPRLVARVIAEIATGYVVVSVMSAGSACHCSDMRACVHQSLHMYKCVSSICIVLGQIIPWIKFIARCALFSLLLRVETECPTHPHVLLYGSCHAVYVYICVSVWPPQCPSHSSTHYMV